jgi:hypothetical protein
MVHALDAESGRELWATELQPFPLRYGDRMFGPATAADGVVLQGTPAGRVYLLDARDGSVLANLSAGGAVQGGISVAGDAFVVPDVGADLWSGSGGVTAYRVNAPAQPVAATPPASTPAAPPPSPPPSGPPIVVTKAPQQDVPPGAGAAVGGRTPGPGLALLTAAGAAAAVAMRAARRRR